MILGDVASRHRCFFCIFGVFGRCATQSPLQREQLARDLTSVRVVVAHEKRPLPVLRYKGRDIHDLLCGGKCFVNP